MRADICEGCVCDKFLLSRQWHISQVDFRFLSADFIIILKDQSIFSGSANEISLTTPLFDNLLLLSLESETLEYVRDYELIACSLRKGYS